MNDYNKKYELKDCMQQKYINRFFHVVMVLKRISGKELSESSE